MADWPELDELKKKLDVSTDDWDDHLTGLLASAIEQVQIDVTGHRDEEVDEITESLAKAALVLAIDLGTTGGEPNTGNVAARLPAYQRLLKGHRVRFGVA
jgi:hypothetical protein